MATKSSLLDWQVQETSLRKDILLRERLQHGTPFTQRVHTQGEGIEGGQKGERPSLHATKT